MNVAEGFFYKKVLNKRFVGFLIMLEQREFSKNTGTINEM